MSQSELESAGASDSLPEGVIGIMRDGRKRYDPQFRRDVAQQCRESGESVAGIALRYGINANLVRTWMGQYSPEESTMLPVTLSTLPPMRERAKPPDEPSTGTVVVELPTGSVRVTGPVDRAVLATIIDALLQR